MIPEGTISNFPVWRRGKKRYIVWHFSQTEEAITTATIGIFRQERGFETEITAKCCKSAPCRNHREILGSSPWPIYWRYLEPAIVKEYSSPFMGRNGSCWRIGMKWYGWYALSRWNLLFVQKSVQLAFEEIRSALLVTSWCWCMQSRVISSSLCE